MQLINRRRVRFKHLKQLCRHFGFLMIVICITVLTNKILIESLNDYIVRVVFEKIHQL